MHIFKYHKTTQKEKFRIEKRQKNIQNASIVLFLALVAFHFWSTKS
jgi:hypothetical protein